MLTPIQIFLLLFILFAITRVYLRAKEKILSIRVSTFWFLTWTAAAVGILLPKTTENIASFFGVGRGVDVIVYISLVLVFYLIFRIYVMIEDLRHEITYIVRQVALQNTSRPARSKRSRRK